MLPTSHLVGCHLKKNMATVGNDILKCIVMDENFVSLLSGVPDYFGRNKISSGGDLSHYSSASLY